MLIAMGTSPEENNVNPIEDSIINEENENIQLEDINEEIEDDVVNTEIDKEQDESNLNNETINTEIEKENKTEEKIDLNNLKIEALSNIPAYSNSPYVVINNNTPFFYDSDLVTTSYEKYADLDSLRKMRCYTCVYRKRYNANRRTWKHRKCEANWLAYCKI